MMEAIQTDRTPNFYFLPYRREPRKQRLGTGGMDSSKTRSGRRRWMSEQRQRSLTDFNPSEMT